MAAWLGAGIFSLAVSSSRREKERARRSSRWRAKRESDSAGRRRLGISGHRAPPPISALAAGEIHLDKAASIADNKPLRCQEAQRPPSIAPRSPAPLSAAVQRAFLSFTPRCFWGTDPPAEKAIAPEYALCRLLNGVDQHLSNSRACSAPSEGGRFLSQPGPGLRGSHLQPQPSSPLAGTGPGLDKPQTGAGRGLEPSPA